MYKYYIIYLFYFFLIFIEIWLICNVVLVSYVQQSDSVLYIYIYKTIYINSFFIFSSIIGYYKILNIVPCAIQ